MDHIHSQELIRAAILRHMDELDAADLSIDEDFFEDLALALSTAARHENLDPTAMDLISESLERLRLNWMIPDMRLRVRGVMPAAV